MWKNFKFYLGILLMCVGCVIPMAIFNLPEEAVGGAGALVVFFAGGGLLVQFSACTTKSTPAIWTSGKNTKCPFCPLCCPLWLLV